MSFGIDSSPRPGLNWIKSWLPLPPGPPLALMQFPPDFAAPDVTHQRTIRLANYRGKQPVVLALLGRHRTALRRQLAESFVVTMNARYPTFQQIGVEVLMVAKLPGPALRTVAADLGLRLPLLSNAGGEIYQQYRTGHLFGDPLPAQFVLDVQGRLRYYHCFSLLHPYANPDQLVTLAQTIVPE